MSCCSRAVIAEVGFHHLYEGQALFGDVCNTLSDMGFHFVRFIDNEVVAQDWSWHRGPIGCRGEGFISNAEALYPKRYRSHFA